MSYLFLISTQGKGRDTMAPHPVVQAVIDLSAGAVGKLQHFLFECVIQAVAVLLHLPTYSAFLPNTSGPCLPSRF